MSEEWRPVVGYEGIYEVSSCGRIKSLARTDRRGHHWSERIRKVSRGHYGHSTLGLCKDGVVSVVSVHHLVLHAFVGPRPDGMECCHNNGDPADNRLENLRWDTRKANNKDRIAHGTAPRGDRNPAARMPAGHVNRIRDLRRFGYTQQQIADWLGIGRRMVGQIVSGNNWIHAQ